MAENREYKSDVFSMLLQDKKNAMELYNGLNGTSYDNPDRIEMFQLDKGISLSLYNDASFIIDMNLNLYEHQSTYNPNIPLRSLIYFVNLVQKLFRNRDLYGHKLIKIPTPHFVVFYNGFEQRPEVEEMWLSTSFVHTEEQPEIELKCTVYNINPGYNEEFLQHCEVLRGYRYFVEKVRFYRKQYQNLTQAIEKSIDDCISNHILEDFFRERRTEVIKVVELDYTWERREEIIRQEEYEEGLKAGKASGVQTGLAALVNSLKKLLPDFSSVYQAIIANKGYENVTEEEVRKFY
jgi:hypothetical protein